MAALNHTLYVSVLLLSSAALQAQDYTAVRRELDISMTATKTAVRAKTLLNI